MTTTAILLVIAAAALFLLEAAIPSFGLFGILAAAAYVYALILGFRESRELGVQVLALGLVLGPPAFFLGMKLMRKTRLGRAAMLAPPTPEETGRSENAADLLLNGKEGVAATDLRPSGKIDLDGRRYEAASVFGFLNKGVRVRVLRAEGGRLLVEAAGDGPPKEHP